MSTPELTQTLIGAAAKAAVIFTVAGAIDLGVLRRRASASTRHLVWTIAIAGSLVVPVLSQVLPPVDVPLPVDTSPAASLWPAENVAAVASASRNVAPPVIQGERSTAAKGAVPIEPNIAVSSARLMVATLSEAAMRL